MKTDTFGTIAFRCDYPNGETVMMTVSGETPAEELKEVFQRFMLAVGYHPNFDDVYPVTKSGVPRL